MLYVGALEWSSSREYVAWSMALVATCTDSLLYPTVRGWRIEKQEQGTMGRKTTGETSKCHCSDRRREPLRYRLLCLSTVERGSCQVPAAAAAPLR
jgi:hypothetical protein